eukprot:CAMPEP_0114563396 /NCGR_PEP_ID=MMETSP0114-20121206/13081_1 /TAXON_ID=31324 /ORGANISM="Goniomonas sp, Strain m" /LENGTH=45 /DNA_ID= /DNA_START= /DNA_END= /DNA_ORIENTATION=
MIYDVNSNDFRALLTGNSKQGVRHEKRPRADKIDTQKDKMPVNDG